MKTLLLVDDSAVVRNICRVMLSPFNLQFREASNGREAVLEYQAHRPDAVLMDLRMPEMDGLEALREIKQFDPEARVAMVTSANQKQVVLSALHYGICDYVVKPFEVVRLRACVEKLLR
ncbi:MAG: response regulator [Chloroflexi bacterium]|nr:response regulator [Chloroflexota bacterium]